MLGQIIFCDFNDKQDPPPPLLLLQIVMDNDFIIIK